MLPRGPAVQLVDPDLLPAQVVRVPRVVLDVKPEIRRALLGFLQSGVRQEEEREGERERERERGRQGNGGETARGGHDTGVDCNVRLLFYGLVLRGLKNIFIYTLYFKAPIRCVNEVSVQTVNPTEQVQWSRSPVGSAPREQCEPGAALTNLYSISTSERATSNYTPEAPRPVALSSNKYLPAGDAASIN